MVSNSRKVKTPLAIEQLLREKYGIADAARAAREIERLRRGEPLDYVIGWVPFLNVEIDLSLKPFVPRPETEFWTKVAIEELRRLPRPLRVLDMFAGSGCIGIAVLKSIPFCHVTFAERNPHLVRQIEINAEKNRVPRERYSVLQSNLFEKIRGRFDAILANPPYVASGERLDPAVRRFEPRSSYAGGRDGLAVIRRFLQAARRRARPGGLIWMEFGSRQQARVRRLLSALGYRTFELRRDHYRRPRFAVIRL